MSEPVTTWRPLIDFDEDERHSGQPEIAQTNEDRARGDLIRLVGDRDENAIEREFATEDASFDLPLVADSRTEAPIIRGDFADIEAALLRTVGQAVAPAEATDTRAPPWARQELRATREEPDDPQTFHFGALSVEGPDAAEHSAPLLAALRDAAFFKDPSAPSDSFILFDDAAVSGSAAIADEDKRSRRPLYIMAALVLAGITGIMATSLRKEGSGEASQEASKPAAIATIAAENTPASSPQPEAASAQAPQPATAQQTAAAQNPEASAPAPVQQAAAAVDATQAVSNAPVSPALATGAAPRVISMSEPAAATPVSASQAPAVQAAVAQVAPPQVTTSQITAPQVAATLPPAPLAPIESEMATGSILAPPPPDKAQALAEPSVKAAMAEAKKVKTAAVRPDGSLVKAEAPAKKAASKVAHLKTPHPSSAAEAQKTAAAARPHAKPADKTAAKAQPATAHDAQLAQAAPTASPQPAAAPQKPAPATPGPLAFVSTAVSSITGATGKLFDWGRSAN